MERDILWSSSDEPGLEHLHLTGQDEGVLADGLIIMMIEHRPFRIKYTIHCDSQWRVREVHIGLLNKSGHDLMLQSDGKGQWTTDSGTPIPLLNGCIDVDISATPFTNTFPIRRLNLSIDETAEILVAYINVPEMEVKTMEQRYTYLETLADGGRYRYESLLSGFTADITVDKEGFVTEYPALFRRITIEP